MSTHPKIQYYGEVCHLGGGVTYTTKRYPTPEEAEAEAQEYDNKPGYIRIIKEDSRSREEILSERFEDWAKTKWSVPFLQRITTHPNGEPRYWVSETQLAWEAFQEGAKAVS